MSHSTSSNPEQRLADGVIANDLLVRRVWIQRLPQIGVLLLSTCNAGKQEARRANGKRIKMLDVLRPFPGALVFYIWIDELRCFAEASAIGKLERWRIGRQ